MTSAAVTSVTKYEVSPFMDHKSAVFTYTKANAGDTLDVSGYGIATVRFAIAQTTGAGTADPVTWSSSTVTFTSGTGAGACIVFGV